MARGEKLGRYTLIEQIAIGGMAEIWLAHMAGLEGFAKLVVIKKIKSHLAQQKSFVQMFLNEARVAAQLNHPHIVQIYDLGKLERTYFIAMEYIFGRDLSEILHKASKASIPFPFEYAIKVISQVCEGLEYAHTQTDPFGASLNIVHRDISPQNIFVSFSGNVKILDFGIAKASNQYEQTQKGMLKGKVSYMSPEQILGDELDGRSDVFGLGIVFYELLTGYRLFSGDNELSIIKSIVEGAISPPSYFNQQIPEDLEAVVMKALAKEPEDRYQSAQEFQYELNQLLSQFEFNPSNLHLANFLKQLFADEMEKEARHLKNQLTEIISDDEQGEEKFDVLPSLHDESRLTQSRDHISTSELPPEVFEVAKQLRSDTQSDLQGLPPSDIRDLLDQEDDDEPENTAELSPHVTSQPPPSVSASSDQHAYGVSQPFLSSLELAPEDEQLYLPTSPGLVNPYHSGLEEEEPAFSSQEPVLQASTQHEHEHEHEHEEDSATFDVVPHFDAAPTEDPVSSNTRHTPPPQSSGSATAHDSVVLRDADNLARQNTYEPGPPYFSSPHFASPLLAHEDGEILMTLRFRSTDYQMLKTIAAARDSSMEELLQKMLQQALPFFQGDLDPNPHET